MALVSELRTDGGPNYCTLGGRTKVEIMNSATDGDTASRRELTAVNRPVQRLPVTTARHSEPESFVPCHNSSPFERRLETIFLESSAWNTQTLAT